MTPIAGALLAGVIGVATILLGANRVQAQQQPVKNIVLVHGAFADGSSWGKIIPILEARGFHVVAVQNPLTSLADDVNATRRAIPGAGLSSRRLVMIRRSPASSTLQRMFRTRARRRTTPVGLMV